MDKDMIEQLGGYYAIIPGKILHCKKLSPQAKLYYCEISRLCNLKGYCWASNKTLGDIFGKSERNVQDCILELKTLGYIFVVINEEAQNVDRRKIYINKQDIPPDIMPNDNSGLILDENIDYDIEIILPY